MNKRDADILTALLVKLTAHFSDPKAMQMTISRGEGRAVIAAIRGWRLSTPKTPGSGQ